MARIRSIHPDACDSEKLAALSNPAERLFWRLQTHCDDDGRCDDNPRLIAAKCTPLLDWDADDVDTLIDELAAVQLVERYEAAGKKFIQVGQWDRFQKPRKPQRGKRPAPGPNQSRTSVVPVGEPVRPVDNQTGHTGTDPRGEPVAHQYVTGTDHEDTPVAHGGEWSGEEWRPPEGGGGSRGEGGKTPRRQRLKPFTGEPAVDPTIARLHANLAAAAERHGTR